MGRLKMFVMLAAAFLPGMGMAEDGIIVGSKSFTESVLLGEIALLQAQRGGVKVWHKKELGGTQILFKALLKGEIDVYPEYTGTIIEQILNGQGSPNDEASLRSALEKQGVRMSRSLGFSNTYAIGMKKSRAGELGIKSIGDLARHADLKFGVSDEFMRREDGWQGLKSAYGLPQRPRVIDHALAYQGIETGGLDVIDVYSTDAEIAFHELVVLDDDKRYFPSYDAVWLYRADLESRAPQAVERLLAVEGKIDSQTMIGLNRGAKIDRESDHNLAAAFLNAQLDGQIELKRPEGMLDILLWATLQHLGLVAASLLAAVATATPLGVLAFRSPKLGHFVLGAVGILQTIPSMALLVILIPLLGIGAKPAMVALFLYSLLPIVRNTHAGLAGIAPAYRETAEVLGLSELARLWMIELPLASPSIFSGIKTAAVINVGTATIGALVGAGGYGAPILTGIRLSDPKLILLGAVPAGLMALGVQGLFSLLERFVVPKGLRVV